MPAFHLAQVNVARLVAPLDSPELSGFVSRLDEVNALADAAPGFVWRLTDDGGNNATAVPIYDDDKIIVNMSVWESVEALRAYTYSGAHLEVFKQRREWFSHMKEAATAHVVGAGRPPAGRRRGAGTPGAPPRARTRPPSCSRSARRSRLRWIRPARTGRAPAPAGA